jgi:hypothetical protein
MPAIEQVIRPFQTQDVAPAPFTDPGTVGVPPVSVQIGRRASPPKTWPFSISDTITYYVSNTNTESPPADGWSG